MSRAADFSGDYSPGGLTDRGKRRSRARRAGIASGVARKRLARGRRPPRRRTRQEALNLSYPHRQLTRKDFACRYEITFPPPLHPPARASWESGLETVWLEYVLTWRLYRARGQHCGTVNRDRAAALSSRGRPRARRSVQRAHRRLEAMGVACYLHERRGGSMPGNKDRLVVEIRTPGQRDTPPPGAGAKPTARAPAGPVNVKNDSLAPAARAVPPDGGDQQPAPEAPRSEDGGVAEQLSFETAHRRLWQAAQEARATLGLASSRRPRRGSDARCI